MTEGTVHPGRVQAGARPADGDELRFNWFVYQQASSYQGDFGLPNPGDARQTIGVPQDLGDRSIHLVLEVRDNGSPELVAYRRVIITVGE